MDLGTRIREKRKERKMTQTELGAPFGISKSGVSEWESGRSKPDIDKLPLLAKTLRTSVDYLLTGKESKYRDIPEAMLDENGEINEEALRVFRVFEALSRTQRDSLLALFESQSGQDS